MKVKVGFVFKVTKTLLELIVALPDWYRAAKLLTPLDPVLLEAEGAGAGVTGVGAGVGAGELLTQTEGCPEQVQLFWILQLMQPAE